MELSKLKTNLFDPFRKSSVAATPEEKVRQRVLIKLKSLGFPKQLIVVEKQLSLLPHLSHLSSVPNRRLDIVCYAKGIRPDHELFPLLLIECKKGNEEAEGQVMGYNHFVGAPYVAIAREGEEILIHPQRCNFIPSYPQLMEQLCL